jgi:predicted enzyme related to lactoylglutathione lyase
MIAADYGSYTIPRRLFLARTHALETLLGRAAHRNAPVNSLGYLRVMFAVEDVDETLERLRKRGAQLVGEVVRYQDAYRLCYIRGPEDLLIGLAQELS